jgi:ribose transport system ATP-binding protein
MDEPTAALSDRETELLFALIARLKADGVAIIYISHRMAEVFALGDRITVLRDGRRIDEVRPGDASPDQLVRMMVGRTVDMSYPRHFAEKPGKVLLEVKGLAAASGISDIDLEVRAGEIVGLCGLVGSGRTEVVRAIFGADKVTAGEIIFDGQRISGGPDQAARRGIALIPENRKGEGLALLRSVADNLVVSALRKLFPSRLFEPRRAQRVADGLVKQLRIATPTSRQTVGLLSGGNQQKVVIGKWLATEAKLFIFDEPTRGIDVGAKSEIFALIDRLVADGAAALMISSEQAEICHVCDRAYVMREGRIAGQLSRAELTEENIVRLGMHHA